ncbi:MAG: bifunctional DNA primase/polymerase [Acidobacteriota bacterium]
MAGIPAGWRAGRGAVSRQSELAAAALWYAEHGIPVFPCKPRGKEPLTSHGFKDATTDQARIAEWWGRCPNANIGVPTGSASELLVWDVDPRNGGETSLKSLAEEHGQFPSTAQQTTGGGGRHFVFRHPGGIRCGVLAAGIDLKADGGYIVVAPSIHPNGKTYQWDAPQGPKALLNPADVPAWLVERIGVALNGRRAEAAVEGDKWAPGERNSRLTSLGGTMRRRGMSREAIEAALLAENRRRCDPPLSEAEVRRIAESVASYNPSEESWSNATCGERSGPDYAHANWPEDLRLEAYHGVAGELVRAIEPHSEADPAALLIQFLIGFGNLIGRQAHFMAEADRHPMNLFAVIVGQTAKGRKGTSLGQVQRVLAVVDPVWSDTRVMGGLASGEGLIWAVRDEIREHVPVREKGRVARYEEVVSDEGVKDKRLLGVEPEFARVLQVTERESNTLSAVIRQAWDTGNLRVLTKKQSARSTEAHISLIGHITKDELRRLLTDTAMANGFANRFLWLCARRSKLLPEGGALHSVDFEQIIRRIQAAVDFARSAENIRRDEEARAIWYEVYADLSEGKPGLLGAVTSRAEAQTMRLACLYALLDSSLVVRAEHLLAALEVWRYCEDSARFIFGDTLGDATADEILRELRQRPQGMTRNDIREHFTRNKSSAEIGRALAVLQEYGLARAERTREEEGQKRPTERWFAVSATRSTPLTRLLPARGE